MGFFSPTCLFPNLSPLSPFCLRDHPFSPFCDPAEGSFSEFTPFAGLPCVFFRLPCKHTLFSGRWYPRERIPSLLIFILSLPPLARVEDPPLRRFFDLSPIAIYIFSPFPRAFPLEILLPPPHHKKSIPSSFSANRFLFNSFSLFLPVNTFPQKVKRRNEDFSPISSAFLFSRRRG